MTVSSKEFIENCIQSNERQLNDLFRTRQLLIPDARTYSESIEKEVELRFLRSLLEKELASNLSSMEYLNKKRKVETNHPEINQFFNDTNHKEEDIPMSERPFF